MRKLGKETTKSIKELGGKETINSGTYGDGDGEIYLDNSLCWGMYNGISVESKMTEKMSFSVKRDILDKIRKEANRKAYLPVLLIGLLNRGKKNTEYIIIKKQDFMNILDWISYLHECIKDNLNNET